MKYHIVQRLGRSGLTLLEVLCGIALLMLLLLLLLPTSYSGNKVTRIKCVNNLYQVGRSLQLFANDHNDLYPMQVAEREGGAREAIARGDVSRIFLVMSSELSIPKTVICPADTREPAADWNAFGRSNVS